jgi:NitT/TauT family transport system substrate-binding protein
MAAAGLKWTVSGVMLILLSACGSAGAPASSPAAPASAAPASAAAPASSAAAKPAASAGAASAKPAAAPSGSAAANPSTAVSGPVFTITTSNQTPSNLFILYAQDKGIFAKNGVKVDLPTMSGQSQMDTVIAGHAEGTLHTGADLVFNSEAATHLGLKVIATGSSVSDSYILARNDITSLDQLRGKKFAMQSTTTGASQLVIRMLQKQGLEPNKDYQIILTGTQGQVSGVLAAIQNGAADAAAVTPAIARPALGLGTVHILTDLATHTELPTGSTVFAVTQATIDKRAADIQKIIDSWMQAEEAISKDKAGAEGVIKKYYKIDDPTALDEEWQRHLDTSQKIPLPTKEQFADIVAAMPKDQPLTDAQFTGMIEPRFVNDAVSRGLGKW